MIKLQVIGNLGKDCIVKEVNGTNVINFSVAHSERYKDNQGNQKERTTWVECAYWSEKTAVAQYLTKGTKVYAEGTPEADAYTNKENQPAATLRMRVSNIQLLGGGDAQPNQMQNAGGGNANSGGSSNVPYSNNTTVQSQTPAASSTANVADDLPF